MPVQFLLPHSIRRSLWFSRVYRIWVRGCRMGFWACLGRPVLFSLVFEWHLWESFLLYATRDLSPWPTLDSPQSVAPLPSTLGKSGTHSRACETLLLLWGLPSAFTSDFQPSIVDLSSQPHVAWLAHWCPDPHGPSVWVCSVCVCVLILLEYSYFTICFCCTTK